MMVKKKRPFNFPVSTVGVAKCSSFTPTPHKEVARSSSLDDIKPYNNPGAIYAIIDAIQLLLHATSLYPS